MNRLYLVPAVALAVAGLAVGCSSSTKNAIAPPDSGGGSSSGAALHTANSKYGQILVDGSGRTLYLLTADTGSKSTCYGACASMWPPDTTTGLPSAHGVTASLVGTTTRTDGTTEVTYKGHPLYTFSRDTKAGDVNGEGIVTFGGTWYVVGTDGNPVTTAPSSTQPQGPSGPSSPSGGSSGGGSGY